MFPRVKKRRQKDKNEGADEAAVEEQMASRLHLDLGEEFPFHSYLKRIEK
jgi:hypothetical protein